MHIDVQQLTKNHQTIKSSVRMTMVPCDFLLSDMSPQVTVACRGSNSNSKFRPRGPLDYFGALACGSISLFARAVEWSGNTADNVLVHSPLGMSLPLPQLWTSCRCICCVFDILLLLRRA